MFAVSAGQQVMGYQQQVQGVKSRNRARLKQFDYQNENYLVETMLNNNKNNYILLMPESSRPKKMKQHCHVKRTKINISKNIYQTQATVKISLTRVKTCSARFLIF